jgi:hypothetical protein
MKLREATGRLSAIGQRLSRPVLPTQPRLTVTRRALEQRFLEGGFPPPLEDLGKVAMRIETAASAGQLGQLAKRDWRKASWCLWLRDHPLASDKRILGGVLDRLRHFDRPSGYASLINAYLRAFREGDESIAHVAGELASIASHYDWPWDERHQKYRIFDEGQAAKMVAAAGLNNAGRVHETLAEIGLKGELATTGLGEVAYRYALENYRDNVQNVKEDADYLSRILDWALFDGNFSYNTLRPNIAEALLLPWADGEDAPEAIMEKTRDFLLKYYDDPRIHQGLWNSVNNSALGVIRRWLAKAALEQFLQIVDDIASPELKLQWPFRRAFWGAYERAGHIAEAWVAFGADGASNARLTFDDTLSYGNLTGGKFMARRAVLILKIGGLTISEWSENGKCHVWLSSNHDAPTLYQSRYGRWDLVNNSDNGGTVHSSSVRGNWQGIVARYIRDKTGITLTESDYMPAGWRRYG